MNIKLSENDCLNIIKLYEDINVGKIAKLYNVDKSTIYNVLKKYNVKTKTQRFQDEYENIIELYNEGFSSVEISKMYNVCKKSVLSLLHKYNVNIRDSKLLHRKYTLNEEYFDNIDDQYKAYILGLFYADGYNDGKGKVSISLQERDVDILLKIKKIINTNIPLNYRKLHEYNDKWVNQYRLYINSKHISKVLNDYGMVPAKSLVLKFPEWLNKDLISHFIRGYLDGDGHIGDRCVSFAGSKYLIPRIKEILETECDIKSLIYESNGCLVLHINRKEDRLKVLNYIYNNADIYLDRKYNKYLEIIEKNK